MEVTASPTAARMLKDFEVGDGSNSVSRDHRGPQKTTGLFPSACLGHLPSGKRLHSYWKDPPFLMGKSTINGPFSIAMLVYQRVSLGTKIVTQIEMTRRCCLNRPSGDLTVCERNITIDKKGESLN